VIDVDRIAPIGRSFRKVIEKFLDDDCTSMAAALAYYATFSLPALLVVVVASAGMIWDEKVVRGSLENEISGVVGEGGKDQIVLMMEKASESGHGTWATLLATALLLVSATGVFAQLQYSLNRAWDAKPDKNGGWKRFFGKRLLSLGMVLALAFVLVATLALTAVLTKAAASVGALGKSWFLTLVIDLTVSWGVIAVLFAAIFKFLPDVQIAWRDAWVGGATTSLLFLVGKSLLGVYLGTKDPGAYGPAGFLVLVLLWIYYTSLIVLFGAELTQVWARQRTQEMLISKRNRPRRPPAIRDRSFKEEA
jgi:membrane protein